MKRFKDVDYIEDLSKLRTREGRHIKPHLLYRSANLSNIKDNEIIYLVNTLNVKHVIDLRTPQEIIEKNEDRISSSVHYWHLPLLTNEENPAINKQNRLPYLTEMVRSKGGVYSFIKKEYLTLINSPHAIKGYKEIFSALASNTKEEGYLIHCTQGKDRTGMVMFLLLSALDIPMHSIRKFYLSFNYKKWFTRCMIWIGMAVCFGIRRANGLIRILSARRRYFQWWIDEINEKHGGLSNYLHNVIGVSEEEINSLKKIYIK